MQGRRLLVLGPHCLSPACLAFPKKCCLGEKKPHSFVAAVAAVDFPPLLASENSFSCLPTSCMALGKYWRWEGLRLSLGLALPLHHARGSWRSSLCYSSLGTLIFLLTNASAGLEGGHAAASPQILKVTGKQQKEITCLKKKQCVNLALRAHLVYSLSKNSHRADLPQNLGLHTCFWSAQASQWGSVLWTWGDLRGQGPMHSPRVHPMGPASAMLAGLWGHGGPWTPHALHMKPGRLVLDPAESSLKQPHVG